MHTETLQKQNRQLPVPVSIDMSRVYRLVRGTHDTHEFPPPEADLRLSAEEPLPKLMLSVPLDPPLALRLSTLDEPTAGMLKLPVPDSPLPLTLQPFDADSYQVQIGGNKGGDTPLRLEIPRGLDRFINAATLKAMVVGAGRDEVLFRKRGARWQICEDGDRIDLEDRTAIFKLGRIEIQS